MRSAGCTPLCRLTVQPDLLGWTTQFDRFEVGGFELRGTGEPIDNARRAENVRVPFLAGRLNACRRTHGFPSDIRTDQRSINVPDFDSGNSRMHAGCHGVLEDLPESLLVPSPTDKGQARFVEQTLVPAVADRTSPCRDQATHQRRRWSAGRSFRRKGRYSAPRSAIAASNASAPTTSTMPAAV